MERMTNKEVGTILLRAARAGVTIEPHPRGGLLLKSATGIVPQRIINLVRKHRDGLVRWHKDIEWNARREMERQYPFIFPLIARGEWRKKVTAMKFLLGKAREHGVSIELSDDGKNLSIRYGGNPPPEIFACITACYLDLRALLQFDPSQAAECTANKIRLRRGWKLTFQGNPIH